jgi:hypothetical protein
VSVNNQLMLRRRGEGSADDSGVINGACTDEADGQRDRVCNVSPSFGVSGRDSGPEPGPCRRQEDHSPQTTADALPVLAAWPVMMRAPRRVASKRRAGTCHDAPGWARRGRTDMTNQLLAKKLSTLRCQTFN